MTGSPLDVLREALIKLDNEERLLNGRRYTPRRYNQRRAALAQVETLVGQVRRVDEIYEGLRTDANDGTFALWSEDDLVRELHGLRPLLAPFVSGSGEAAPTSSMFGSEGETV